MAAMTLTDFIFFGGQFLAVAGLLTAAACVYALSKIPKSYASTRDEVWEQPTHVRLLPSTDPDGGEVR